MSSYVDRDLSQIIIHVSGQIYIEREKERLRKDEPSKVIISTRTNSKKVYLNHKGEAFPVDSVSFRDLEEQRDSRDNFFFFTCLALFSLPSRSEKNVIYLKSNALSLAE